MSGFFVATANATVTSIILTSPNGGEVWSGTKNITWTQTGAVLGDLINISLSLDGVSYNTLITTTADGTAGFYAWDTNQTAAGALTDGSTYRIRLTSGSGLDFSSNNFMVDNTAPVTTHSITGGVVGLDSWYTTPPSFTLNCTDNLSGCANTTWRINNGSWNTGTTITLIQGVNSVEWQSTDNAGNVESINGPVEVKVDTGIPTVAVTSTPSSGAYNEGEAINVTLTFSEPVTTTDTITVTLETGATDRTCIVPIMTSATVGTCTYIVQAGDTSGDLTTNSIAATTGSVLDIAGNTANLTPSSNLADTSAIVVDTTAPSVFTTGTVTVTGGTVVSGWWNSTNTGATVEVPFAVDSSLTGPSGMQLQADAGSGFENIGSAEEIYVTYFTPVPTSVSFPLTALQIEAITEFSEGVAVTFRAIITDLAGNSTTGANSADTFIVDQVVPVVDAGTDKEVNAVVSQNAITSDGGSGLNTHTWSKQTGTGTITFGTGTLVDTTISANTDDTYTIRLTVTDIAGNSAFEDIQFAWDTTVPVVTQITPISTPTNDTTPSYVFNVDSIRQLVTSVGGVITYGGSCGNGTLSSAVTFTSSNTTTYGSPTLADATYADCTITVTDAAGNTSGVLTLSSFEIDTAMAAVSSITTTDANLDGMVDTATIVFTDEMKDSTFNFVNFTIGGIPATTFSTGITANDNTIVLSHAGVAGTDAKTVAYVPGTVTDLAGNSIAGFSQISTDAAGPVLLSAKTTSITTIDALFSENLNGATINDSGTEFTVTGFVVSDADDGSDDTVTLTVATMPTDATPDVTFTNTGTFQDLNSNEAVTPVTVTAVDEVAPTLTTVSIASDNAKDTTLAKEGDTIMVSFTASEGIATPTVTIQGVAATTITNISGDDWEASRVMISTDTEGAVSFSIDFEDVVTPANVGTNVDIVTDTSLVSYDRTDPVVNAGSDREVNATVAPQGASASDAGSGVDTYAWTHTGPGIVTYSNQSGTGTGVNTNLSADTDGTYTITLTVEDEAGNIGTDSLIFIWDTTKPELLTSSPVDGATGIAIDAGTATVTFDEPIVLIDSAKILLVDDLTNNPYTSAVAVSGTSPAVLTIAYSGLVNGTVYRINVKSNAVRDVAGNVVTTPQPPIYFTTAINTVVPITPTVTLPGAPIVSAYTATDAGTRFASGLQFDTTNATGVTVNGTSLTPAATITAATLAEATTIGAHAYNVVVTSTTGHIANITVSYQVNADTVGDTTAPVITLLGVNPQTLTVGDSYIELGATASDNVDGDISSSITIDSSAVNMTTAGTYTVTYNVSDTATNPATQETRTVIVNPAFDDTASLAVTGISTTKSYATTDDTFANGWKWTFHVTVPTNETLFAMKFADFVSGANTIPAAANIRYYSAQASANAASTTAVTIAGANAYPGSITLDSDLDTGTAGRQIAVTVEMKVPVGSAGGSYSSSYQVQSL